MKLYAVTKGSYSDYHIITLSRSKRRAERIAQKCSDKYDDAVVEEYEDSDFIERPIWHVLFYRDGFKKASTVPYEDQFSFDKPLNTVKEFELFCRFEVYCEAKDEAHAIKTAVDLVAQYCYERDIPLIYRRRYFCPTVGEMLITPGQWFDAGDGLWMCSACRQIVDLSGKESSCNACGAVMNAVKFCEEVFCDG